MWMLTKPKWQSAQIKKVVLMGGGEEYALKKAVSLIL